MNHVTAFVAAHKLAAGALIAIYLAFATWASKRWPKPAAPWWKVALHFIFIDLAAAQAAKNGTASGFVIRVFGVEIAVPGLSWTTLLRVLQPETSTTSRADASPPAPVIQLPPPIRSGEDNERGATLFGVMLVTAMAAIAGALLFGGCAHDPPTKARQYVIGGYAAHGAAAVGCEIANEECANSALQQPAKDKKQAALDDCKQEQSIMSRVLHSYVDALKIARRAIDAAERLKAKDYSGAIAPLEAAGKELDKGLHDAGVKLPVPIPGVK